MKLGEINVDLIDKMGDDLTVVRAARVSYAKSSDYVGQIHSGEAKEISNRDRRLINYLAKHKHTSPFGHAFVSFRIDAPVYVARQLVKHKFLRWNEVSRRYVSYLPQFYEPYWRSKPENSKQGSGGPMEISEEAEMMYHATMRNALTTYDLMIKEGVSPEQARSVLPQNMMTSWVWSGSLDAFADMCVLRCAKDTQAETRIVANSINSYMLTLFPYSWCALMDTANIADTEAVVE
jgi:thymidylate synthase (FAD)